MAIPHAQPGDVINVRPMGSALAGASSHALFKSADLEVMRLVLAAGDEMPAHAVSGEITLQCIEGRIAFTCDAGVRELSAGDLVRCAAEEVHCLRGIEHASLLLTIALKKSPSA